MPDESMAYKMHAERMARITEILKRHSLMEFRPFERPSLRQLRTRDEIRLFGRELLSPSEELKRRIPRPDISIR